MTLRLSREEAILVEAAGGASPAADVVAEGGPIDWQQVLELAAWHRLLPLLWHHLTERGEHADQVPSAVLGELRRFAREALAGHLRLEGELRRALAALDEAGIPVVLLKGAALVEAVYAHQGLRPMADLDLLVPPDDVRRAFDVVQGLGYEVRGPKVRARDDDAWLASLHHHLPLVTPSGSVLVELHHRLVVDRPDYDVDGVWARAIPSEAPPPHLLPAPEDLFLHVAAHFALDRINRERSGLGQLADLVRISRRWDLDWAAIADRARGSGVADRLFLALSSAQLLFGDLAPPPVLTTLTPASYSRRRGELFVRHRVLRMGEALPLEQLAGGRSRLFGAHTLEVYVRSDDDAVPSRTRLRARRFASIATRAVRLLRRPRRLVEDIHLTRWVLRLRG